MNFRIKLSPEAEKQLRKLDRKMQGRVREALLKLGASESPTTAANVKPLVGNLSGDCRLRIGDYRVIFTPLTDESIIYIYSILPCGAA